MNLCFKKWVLTFKFKIGGQAWWCMPLIPAIRRQRQMEFKDNPVYIVSSRTARKKRSRAHKSLRFLKYLFLFYVYECFVLMWVSAPCVCNAWGGQKSVRTCGTILQIVVSHHGCWGLNLDPPQEQQVLLTAHLSLLPHPNCFEGMCQWPKDLPKDPTLTGSNHLSMTSPWDKSLIHGLLESTHPTIVIIYFKTLFNLLLILIFISVCVCSWCMYALTPWHTHGSQKTAL